MSSREAVRHDDVLGAPSVGTWRPAIGLGAPLAPGVVLGSLLRDGCVLTITAPAAVGGVATSVTRAGTWVAYDDVLVTHGEIGVAGITAAVSRQPTGGPEGCLAVRAETDGTVYLRAEPGAPPFAAVDAEVEAHATLALVEVMKTFTPVKSPVAGTVVRVDVGEAAGVSEGTPLFWLRPR